MVGAIERVEPVRVVHPLWRFVAVRPSLSSIYFKLLFGHFVAFKKTSLVRFRLLCIIVKKSKRFDNCPSFQSLRTYLSHHVTHPPHYIIIESFFFK